MSEALVFDVVQDGHRYRALIDGEEAAYVEADPIAADGLLLKHTEVLAKFEGRGIGGALVRHVLEEAKRQGRGVVPVCPYAAAWIKRHPEFMDHVRESYRAVLR